MKSRGKPKRARSIRFDEKDLELANKLGIDISDFCRQKLKSEITLKLIMKENKK
jgi:hypothetical protein